MEPSHPHRTLAGIHVSHITKIPTFPKDIVENTDERKYSTKCYAEDLDVHFLLWLGDDLLGFLGF
jgi:hypothetical protein